MLKNAGPWLISIVLVVGLMPGGVGIGPTPATAGPDLWTEVVAPYVHLPVEIPAATGTLSTIFFVRSPDAARISVQVQCFNNFSQFVGPTPQPAFVDAEAFQTLTVTPDTLTDRPNFTGLGWCYFSSTNKFSVDVAWGILGGPPDPLGFSVGVSVAVGQATVAAGVQTVSGPPIPGIGNVPLWVGGNWFDLLVLVNPTASTGSASVDVFNCPRADPKGGVCIPTPTPTTVPVSLPARGMGFVVLSDFVDFLPSGNATIRSDATCCFVAWHWAINLKTGQALFREVPLDPVTSRFLTPADRP